MLIAYDRLFIHLKAVLNCIIITPLRLFDYSAQHFLSLHSQLSPAHEQIPNRPNAKQYLVHAVAMNREPNAKSIIVLTAPRFG